MNEHQQRELAKYEDSTKRLKLIVDEMNKLDMGDDIAFFEMQPVRDDMHHTPRIIYIKALIKDGELEIMCDRNGYGNRDRWEFTAIGWPTYTNEHGNTKICDPSNLWNPKETRQSTTASENREPKVIARQIVSKILPEYQRIYGRCKSRAESYQIHSDERADGLRRLANACRDEDRYASKHGTTMYIRNLPGNTVGVESRSHGDVNINLHTDEIIEVIALLRRLRADAQIKSLNAQKDREMRA